MNPRKLLTLGMLAVLFAAIPVSVFFIQQRQQTQSSAAALTTLSFINTAGETISQATPLQSKVGEAISLQLKADPGKNFINVIKLSMLYDPQKLTPVNGSCGKIFCPDGENTLRLLGEITTTGNTIVLTLATSNPADALQKASKLGTITLQAKETTAPTTQISFGQDTFVTSGNCDFQTGTCPDQPGENVLQSTSPAFITVTNTDLASTTPTGNPIGATETTPTTTPAVSPTRASQPAPTTPPQAAIPTPTPYRAPVAPTAAQPTQPPQQAPTAVVAQQTAAPTLQPGPNEVILGIGGLGIALAIVGGFIFFLL